jgi:DNA-binding NtrC family response regulator
MSPKWILVVDDDLNLRHSLALVLKSAGYTVTTAGLACEALECLEHANYDLAILDVVMIDNRLNLLPSVLHLYPHLPILVFTAEWSPETAVETEKLGVRAHLVKPVTPKCLLECVDTILNSSPVMVNPQE